MVPLHEQPVRSPTVARVAAALAVALLASRPGTRVLAPEVLWHAAQGNRPADLVDDWLAARPLQAAPVRQRW